jgi:hypothetical protein
VSSMHPKPGSVHPRHDSNSRGRPESSWAREQSELPER